MSVLWKETKLYLAVKFHLSSKECKVASSLSLLPGPL